jgi:hypothetical protein
LLRQTERLRVVAQNSSRGFFDPLFERIDVFSGPLLKFSRRTGESLAKQFGGGIERLGAVLAIHFFKTVI